MTEETRYEEREGLAIITLNRPEKRNALTDAMVQGVAVAADIDTDTDTASADVATIVLRGEAGTLTAGYDLASGDVERGNGDG